MHAIYVLEGESQTGPFSPDEIRRAIASNALTLAHLGWYEGCEGWKPLSEILADADEEDVEVVQSGPGYVLTTEALRVRDEIFALDQVSRATVEVEHTRRGRPIAATIFFGFLVVVALAMPHKPETPTQWILWALSLLLFLVFFLRFALTAFRPSATFLAIHLADGDDRILPMSRKDAESAREAIHQTLARRQSVEENSPPSSRGESESEEP